MSRSKKRLLVVLTSLVTLSAAFYLFGPSVLRSLADTSPVTPSSVPLIRSDLMPDTSGFSYNELEVQFDAPVRPEEHFSRLPAWDGDPAHWPGVGGWDYVNVVTDDGVHIVMGIVYDFPSTLANPRERSFSFPFEELTPMVTIRVSLPNGERYSTVAFFEPEEYSNDSASFDVQAGPNRIMALDQNLDQALITGSYRNRGVLDSTPGIDFRVQVDNSQSVPIRIGTGYHLYGPPTDYQGHLISISNGRVTEGNLLVGQDIYDLENALVYVDRGWGNVGLTDVVTFWYWMSGTVGDKTFQLTRTIGSRDLHFDRYLTVFVAEGKNVVANNPADLTWSFTQPETPNPELGFKPASLFIKATFHDEQGRLHVIETEPYETLLEDTLFSQLLRVPVLNGLFDRFDVGGHYGRYLLRVTYTIYPGYTQTGTPVYQATSVRTTAEILMPGGYGDVVAAVDMYAGH